MKGYSNLPITCILHASLTHCTFRALGRRNLGIGEVKRLLLYLHDIRVQQPHYEQSLPHLNLDTNTIHSNQQLSGTTTFSCTHNSWKPTGNIHYSFWNVLLLKLSLNSSVMLLLLNLRSFLDFFKLVDRLLLSWSSYFCSVDVMCLRMPTVVLQPYPILVP